jgi:predicted small secreted protein
MRSIRRTLRRTVSVLLLPPTALLAACGENGYTGIGPVQETGQAVQFGIWTPGTGDTCTREIHDRYSVVAPDGKRYNTWHPPVDPGTGCTFGHEHGRDPRSSAG